MRRSELAKKIRKILKENYPETEFSVCYEDKGIRIEWINNPVMEELSRKLQDYGIERSMFYLTHNFSDEAWLNAAIWVAGRYHLPVPTVDDRGGAWGERMLDGVRPAWIATWLRMERLFE